MNYNANYIRQPYLTLFNTFQGSSYLFLVLQEFQFMGCDIILHRHHIPNGALLKLLLGAAILFVHPVMITSECMWLVQIMWGNNMLTTNIEICLYMYASIYEPIE